MNKESKYMNNVSKKNSQLSENCVNVESIFFVSLLGIYTIIVYK